MEAAISGVNKTVDRIINCTLLFVTKWSPEGQIVKETNVSIITS